MALAVLLCLSCGALVSCRIQGAEPDAGGPGGEANTVWDTLKANANLYGLDDRGGLAYTALASVSGEGYTLAALCIKDWNPR